MAVIFICLKIASRFCLFHSIMFFFSCFFFFTFLEIIYRNYTHYRFIYFMVVFLLIFIAPLYFLFLQWYWADIQTYFRMCNTTLTHQTRNENVLQSFCKSWPINLKCNETNKTKTWRNYNSFLSQTENPFSDIHTPHNEWWMVEISSRKY